VKFDTEVRRDIADGTLPVRDKDTLAVIRQENLMQDSHRTTVVSVEDFGVYAKLFLIDVRAGAPATASGPDAFSRIDRQGGQDESAADHIEHSGTHLPAEHTECKRAAIIKTLGRRFAALRSALDRSEEWTKACRVPGRSGWYYLEKIEAECRARYGGATSPAVDMGIAAQLRAAGK